MRRRPGRRCQLGAPDAAGAPDAGAVDASWAAAGTATDPTRSASSPNAASPARRRRLEAPGVETFIALPPVRSCTGRSVRHARCSGRGPAAGHPTGAGDPSHWWPRPPSAPRSCRAPQGRSTSIDGDDLVRLVGGDQLGPVSVTYSISSSRTPKLVQLAVLRLERERHARLDLDGVVERPDARDDRLVVLGQAEPVAPEVGGSLVLLLVAPGFLGGGPLRRRCRRS